MIVSARKRRQGRKRVAAIIFLAIGISIVGSMIWLRMSATSTKLNADTLCPVDAAITGFAVLLIDGTDSFSPIQRADIERNLQAFAKGLGVGERLTVFAPTEMKESDFLQPVFEKCNPGTDAEVSELTQNPRQIQLRYERGFRDQLMETLRSGLSTNEKSRSPIMAMIQAAVIRGFPAGADDRPKRLVIVSDMLENTYDYSQYSETLDFDAVKERPFFAHLSIPLDRTEVEILYVTRIGAEDRQTRRHVLFWEEYFRFLNGELIRVTRVGG
jgi:hypothetical protein